MLDLTAALLDVGLFVHSSGANLKMTLDNNFTWVNKFLNRIVGVPFDLQTRLFKYFTDILSANVIQAKKSGRYKTRTLDLRCLTNVRSIELYTFIIQTDSAAEKLTIKIRSIEVDRGMSWMQAKNKWVLIKGHKPTGGFYLSKKVN